ncbi:DUF4136 domain-containing protein [Caulobacter sp. 17J80-11]|uniref:DUF4136 domain-containing protein n=1 Tax=Caulobacter sp. 17J80-11 TaxID=2763502 RepID=UPI00165342D8|nr:DUF4136 domain-containing protein [Caulobacter sp. 17J80-11]MBC6982651.1 DUF4136 domain-containing protein [Caulobacter sp. 17J80-11]
MHRRLFASALLALALGACASTPQVSSDVAPGVNFSQYSTYQWAASTMPAGVDPVLGQRVKDAIDGQMAAKGYTKATPGSLIVMFNMGAHQETDIQSYGAWGLGLDVEQYTEGVLNIDVFDARTKQAIWHGSAKQILGNNPDPSKITGVVVQTMASLPPRVAPPPAASAAGD